MPILSQIETGDPSAAELLLPIVYDELRKLAEAMLARERPGQTLQATALVHEAYMRLVAGDEAQHWNSRGHFFGAAAEAIRRILLNRARDKNRYKRGGDRRRIDLADVEVAVDTPDEELLALDEALERLRREHAACADVVTLRFFGGLSMREAADVLGISVSTADRYWAYARAWLFSAMRSDAGHHGR
jgi:RNA polymerase sigma factor (TIGR02999 family)